MGKTAHSLKKFRCVKCRKVLLMEDVEQGHLEILCRRCHEKTVLIAAEGRKLITAK